MIASPPHRRAGDNPPDCMRAIAFSQDTAIRKPTIMVDPLRSIVRTWRPAWSGVSLQEKRRNLAAFSLPSDMLDAAETRKWRSLLIRAQSGSSGRHRQTSALGH